MPLATDVDAAARVEAAVLAKVGDGVVRAAEAAVVKADRAKAGADHAKVDAVLAKVGAGRVRAEEALVKVDGVRADVDRGEASRHVIRRLLRNRVPTVSGAPGSGVPRAHLLPR